MRGSDGMQETLSTMSKLEDFVPRDHPLRPTRELVNQDLSRLSGLFNTMYADNVHAHAHGECDERTERTD